MVEGSHAGRVTIHVGRRLQGCGFSILAKTKVGLRHISYRATIGMRGFGLIMAATGRITSADGTGTAIAGQNRSGQVGRRAGRKEQGHACNLVGSAKSAEGNAVDH